jgi:ATP-dependent DNA helicase RecQ
VCDPSIRPAVPQKAPARAASRAPRQLVARPLPSGQAGMLDEAILDVVAGAEPAVGRTRAVEILRGGRSKVILQNSYDGLPHYGAFANLNGPTVLARVDALLGSGALRSTGGRFPKLEVV